MRKCLKSKERRSTRAMETRTERKMMAKYMRRCSRLNLRSQSLIA